VPSVPLPVTDSVEPVTVARNSPTSGSDQADSSVKRLSASGSTPPPASPASLASSAQPTTPRWSAAESADGGQGLEPEEAVPSTPVEVHRLDGQELPNGKNGRSGYGPGSASGKAPSKLEDPNLSTAASLAAAALASDTPSSGAGSGYAPPGYSDYSPPGYSAKDPVWPSRAASSGYPPATQDDSRTSTGYSPSESTSRPSPSPSIWTNQDSVSGKVGYSPSGNQRPDSGSGYAGTAGSQPPGRLAASQQASAGSASGATDDLVSKLKAPFGQKSQKKRKPARPSGSGSSRSGQYISARTGSGSSGSGNGALAAGAAVGAAAAAAVGGAATALKPKPAARRGQGTKLSSPNGRPDSAESRRDAQLVVSRIDPWSVMKFSFVISIVVWIVLVVAVALLYYALRALGVFSYLEQTYSTVTSSKGHPAANAGAWFSASTVVGYTLLIGAVNVVLMTALATVGSVIYNLITRISGGVEVTLREAD
jgi:hypothetical protein